MSQLKDKIEQRVLDLKGGGEKKVGQLIEATAWHLVHRDMMMAAEVARDVATKASIDIDNVEEPAISDVLAIHQLYQAYLGPAYQTLVEAGDIPRPPVPTNNSGVKTKDQLDS
jgi:hypothetical protein